MRIDMTDVKEELVSVNAMNKDMMELPDNPCEDPLNPQQRNWLYMILKALYDSRFDGSFDDNDMQTINTIMHDLNLYYDSSDEGSR